MRPPPSYGEDATKRWGRHLPRSATLVAITGLYHPSPPRALVQWLARLAPHPGERLVRCLQTSAEVGYLGLACSESPSEIFLECRWRHARVEEPRQHLPQSRAEPLMLVRVRVGQHPHRHPGVHHHGVDGAYLDAIQQSHISNRDAPGLFEEGGLDLIQTNSLIQSFDSDFRIGAPPSLSSGEMERSAGDVISRGIPL